MTINSAIQAIDIIECHEDTTLEEFDQAFQYLIDTGTVWHLQGWYGRTANNLIADGRCTYAKQNI